MLNARIFFFFNISLWIERWCVEGKWTLEQTQVVVQRAALGNLARARPRRAAGGELGLSCCTSRQAEPRVLVLSSGTTDVIACADSC